MLIFPRSGSYIGTLIDDLVTKDINEPYRMLTSRSEYRLLLRQDNADERLTPTGYQTGLISAKRYNAFLKKQKDIEAEMERLSNEKVPASPEVNEILAKYNESIEKGMKLDELLRRPKITYEIIKEIHPQTKELNVQEEVYKEAEIKIKYSGYIKRQNQQIDILNKLEKIKIPENINYEEFQHISAETREKLSKIRPVTLAQASRIGGVKPADISVLTVILSR
jgi:tRNA uridine 5-carboxymethylaminomethyl modification enzyme